MCYKVHVNFQEQKQNDNLAQQAIKGHKCQACINLLLDRDCDTPLQPVSLHATQEEVDSFLLEEDVNRSFTKLLDRSPALLEGGGLLTPNYMAMKTTDDICQLYKFLMKVSFFFPLSN